MQFIISLFHWVISLFCIPRVSAKSSYLQPVFGRYHSAATKVTSANLALASAKFILVNHIGSSFHEPYLAPRQTCEYKTRARPCLCRSVPVPGSARTSPDIHDRLDQRFAIGKPWELRFHIRKIQPIGYPMGRVDTALFNQPNDLRE